MCVAAFPQQASAQTIETYREMCDASAAVALGSDHFVVANDELNALKIYQRGQPTPTSSIDLSSFLGTKPKNESDLEGAAMIGNRIYWISSHGTNSEGEVQERRHRLFATEIVGTTPPTVKAVDKPYTTLVKDLNSKFPELNLEAAAKIAPKLPKGLNIEGLAADNGTLLIGFRNPLFDDEALIVPLENPEDVVTGKAPRFGVPSRLGLDKRGIRSIERIRIEFSDYRRTDRRHRHVQSLQLDRSERPKTCEAGYRFAWTKCRSDIFHSRQGYSSNPQRRRYCTGRRNGVQGPAGRKAVLPKHYDQAMTNDQRRRR